MVAVKGLSMVKTRVSGDRETTRKSGGVKGLKVFEEDAKVKDRDRVAAETKRKSIPVKAEISGIHANCQKVLNKLDKIKGKSINSAQTTTGRKVLADISNSKGIFQKNAVVDGSKPGKGKMERMAYSQRTSVSSGKELKVFNGNPKTRGQETGKGKTERMSYPQQRASVSSSKDLKVLSGNSKTRVQETAGYIVRKSARAYCPPQRKSLPVLKHADKEEKSDNKKGDNKEKLGFSVKPKVGTKVVPNVSNTRDYLRKNRVSDGYIKMASNGQSSTGDKKRLSRISMKPTVKTAVGIPKAQRVSRTTSVFTKSTSSNSVLSKKVETSKSESVSRKQIAQDVTLDASTSNLTSKVKSGRRKSYTSLLIERTKLLKDQVGGAKEEILPDIYDDGNQLEVAEYVDEIYQHYWVTEAHNQPLKNYMEIQTDITPQMRGILINWLIEVHLKFDLMQETLYLMVTLLDFYLSAAVIRKTDMQLVGLTSLLLASKYEDFWHPKVMELISISAETYTREQMLGLETTILKTLNFRLNLPTPYVFMLRFLRAAQGGKKFENLAYFLIELCLVEYDALLYKPSLLCASAIYVARCTLNLTPAWTPLLCKHSRYQEFQIRDCADMILGFHQAARKAVLRVTYDKYTSSQNCKVALIKPLDRLPPP
ncbi:putative cyclin domain-containing protein [Helianthus annuus]|uniref:Cyclin n=1 Tax=Helianthus annuus TaxID=4232 RepID=A0A9K3MZK3_HELAN|nr:putative cyclin [Helianthus annuus]KAJ0508765.1 putative cyclin domain-containing protein [Helianthus annuus]KAJ0870120.1 putative cyclin domain-containing protein [Helianthus annuus]KAJ0874599.1 putative Cyclin-like superfamily [Helianthus annuus]